MKERITFIHPPGGGVDPEDLEIQEAGLLGPQIDSARQDRLTIPLDELPAELSEVLRDFKAVHVRWTSPLQYETLDPFTSRTSPGFHLSYTPVKDGLNDVYVVLLSYTYKLTDDLIHTDPNSVLHCKYLGR